MTIYLHFALPFSSSGKNSEVGKTDEKDDEHDTSEGKKTTLF